MATELLDQDTVLHVTDVEESAALTSVLAEAGITLEELREQARSGEFESLEARMAWHVHRAVGGV